jgi:hypothetical protein
LPDRPRAPAAASAASSISKVAIWLRSVRIFQPALLVRADRGRRRSGERTANAALAHA